MKRNRRGGHKPSNVLTDSNFLEDSSERSSSDEELVKRNKIVQRRKSFIELDKDRQRAEMGPPQRGEKRKSGSGGFSSGFEGTSEDERASDSENHVETTGNRNKRFRRRLSTRRDEARNSSGLNISYGNLNSTIGSPSTVTASPKKPTDKKTLQDIYSTCSALFQAHKITPQNAFSLKLVECLDEIIESEDFDKKNLPLLARTLEIGGKIYVCRVDCTHAHTIKLAGEITAHQNEAASNEEGDHPDEAEGQVDVQDDVERKKRTRARVKKRSRFIEENDTKLNTRFEDQSTKYASRRTSLKVKLHRNIDEELDFDYLSYFVKPGEEHPLENPDEFGSLSQPGHVPDSHVNEAQMKDLPWLPFNVVQDWDSTKLDIWGVPLAVDLLDVSGLNSQPTPPDGGDDNEFAYNPDIRPEEYPLPEFPDSGGDHMDDLPEYMYQGDASMPVAVDNLKSLDDLRKFFMSLKGAHLVMKNKYGWAGPVFLKPARLDGRKRPDGCKKQTQQRKKKTVVVIYDEVDWKDPNNKFVTADKTTIDDKTLNKWSTSLTVAPCPSYQQFLCSNDEEADFMNPFDTQEASEDSLATVIRFFADPNKNIFKLMEEEFKEGKCVLSQSVLGKNMGQSPEEEAFPDMDIEAPRDYADDSIGNMALNPEIEPCMPGFDDFAAGMNLSAMFPGSLGFDTNDPMSKASEFDSVKFAKQPKPIDMHALKVFIRKILTEKLETDNEGHPTSEEEKKIDVLALISELMKRVDSRMAKHMSMAIIIVGLMHVVADNKYFMMPPESDSTTEYPSVVCRGKSWKHKDHIPMGDSRCLEV